MARTGPSARISNWESVITVATSRILSAEGFNPVISRSIHTRLPSSFIDIQSFQAVQTPTFVVLALPATPHPCKLPHRIPNGESACLLRYWTTAYPSGQPFSDFSLPKRKAQAYSGTPAQPCKKYY